MTKIKNIIIDLEFLIKHDFMYSNGSKYISTKRVKELIKKYRNKDYKDYKECKNSNWCKAIMYVNWSNSDYRCLESIDCNDFIEGLDIKIN